MIAQAGRLRRPTTITNITVTETAKEGKTMFRLEPGARTAAAAPNNSPMLVAFGGHGGPLPDGCAHDPMLRMTAVMASGLAGR